MNKENKEKINTHYPIKELITGIVQNISLLGLYIEDLRTELKEVKTRAYNNFSDIREMSTNTQRMLDVLFDEVDKLKQKGITK